MRHLDDFYILILFFFLRHIIIINAKLIIKIKIKVVILYQLNFLNLNQSFLNSLSKIKQVNLVRMPL